MGKRPVDEKVVVYSSGLFVMGVVQTRDYCTLSGNAEANVYLQHLQIIEARTCILLIMFCASEACVLCLSLLFIYTVPYHQFIT